MVLRRHFLIGSGMGIAALSSTLASGSAAASQQMAAPSSVNLLLVDSLIDGAGAAASAAARLGISVAQYTGDIGAPWLETLEPSWRREPQTVLGVTYAGAVFCLEQLARTYGLACAFRSSLPSTGQASSVSLGDDAGKEEALASLLAEALTTAARKPSTQWLKRGGDEPGDAVLVWLLQPQGGQQAAAMVRS